MIDFNFDKVEYYSVLKKPSALLCLPLKLSSFHCHFHCSTSSCILTEKIVDENIGH